MWAEVSLATQLQFGMASLSACLYPGEDLGPEELQLYDIEEGSRLEDSQVPSEADPAESAATTTKKKKPKKPKKPPPVVSEEFSMVKSVVHADGRGGGGAGGGGQLSNFGECKMVSCCPP